MVIPAEERRLRAARVFCRAGGEPGKKVIAGATALCYGEYMELKNPRDERCVSDGWAFTGIKESGRGARRKLERMPLGVYSTYQRGRDEADAWLATSATHLRWEGEQLHKDAVEE